MHEQWYQRSTQGGMRLKEGTGKQYHNFACNLGCCLFFFPASRHFLRLQIQLERTWFMVEQSRMQCRCNVAEFSIEQPPIKQAQIARKKSCASSPWLLPFPDSLPEHPAKVLGG